MKGRRANGFPKQRKARARKASNKYDRRKSHALVADSQAWNKRAQDIMRTQERTSPERTTQLVSLPNSQLGVVARKNLNEYNIATTYPANVEDHSVARKHYSHLEDYWFGITGEDGSDLVAIPAIGRIGLVSKTGLTALGCFANEPGPTTTPNVIITLKGRKKKFKIGQSLTLNLTVGKGCCVKEGDQLFVYYGPSYKRNYRINEIGCQNFQHQNGLGYEKNE